MGKTPFNALLLPVVFAQSYHRENAKSQHYLSHKTSVIIVYGKPHKMKENRQQELFISFSLFKWCQFLGGNKHTYIPHVEHQVSYLYFPSLREDCMKKHPYSKVVNLFHYNFTQHQIWILCTTLFEMYVIKSRWYDIIQWDAFIMLCEVP